MCVGKYEQFQHVRSALADSRIPSPPVQLLVEKKKKKADFLLFCLLDDEFSFALFVRKECGFWAKALDSWFLVNGFRVFWHFFFFPLSSMEKTVLRKCSAERLSGAERTSANVCQNSEFNSWAKTLCGLVLKSPASDLTFYHFGGLWLPTSAVIFLGCFLQRPTCKSVVSWNALNEPGRLNMNSVAQHAAGCQ